MRRPPLVGRIDGGSQDKVEPASDLFFSLCAKARDGLAAWSRADPACEQYVFKLWTGDWRFRGDRLRTAARHSEKGGAYANLVQHPIAAIGFKRGFRLELIFGSRRIAISTHPYRSHHRPAATSSASWELAKRTRSMWLGKSLAH